jgi:transmembrane sensor
MTQFEFDKLLEKYLAGDCTPDEERMIENWSENQILFTPLLQISAREEKETEKRLKKRIDTSTVGSRNFWKISTFYRWGLAASLVGMMIFGGWCWMKPYSKTLIDTNLARFELSNNTNIEQIFYLKDGSEITLKPQSKLTYGENFGVKDRKVYLKGEGLFQVKRDTAKPFYVFAGELVTKVLGTTFSVKTFKDGRKTEVVVTQGKVMVYENRQDKMPKGIVLTPNLKIDYINKSVELKPQIVDNPIVIHPVDKKEDFVFEKIPLSVVLNRLKKVYCIDILTRNPTIEKCLFTGNLNDLTLYQQLDLICQSLDAHYEKYETAIWITGEGCSN